MAGTPRCGGWNSTLEPLDSTLWRSRRMGIPRWRGGVLFCDARFTEGSCTRFAACGRDAGQFSRWGRGPVLPVGARPGSPGGGPADKAREGGAPTGRTGPGVFRLKRNDERRAATRFSRDGSPAERRVGFITGCLAGMDRRPNAAWVSSPAVQPGWIAGRAPTGRTGPRGFHHRLFGRDGSPVERRVGFATGC